jgi:hypothetical protein
MSDLDRRVVRQSSDGRYLGKQTESQRDCRPPGRDLFLRPVANRLKLPKRTRRLRAA